MAGKGQNQLSCPHVRRPAHLHPHHQSQLFYAANVRFGPAFPSAAAYQGQGQLSHSYDLKGRYFGVARRSISPLFTPLHDKQGVGPALPHSHPWGQLTTTIPAMRVSSSVIPRYDTGPTLLSAASTKEQGHLCTLLGHRHDPR